MMRFLKISLVFSFFAIFSVIFSSQEPVLAKNDCPGQCIDLPNTCPSGTSINTSYGCVDGKRICCTVNCPDNILRQPMSANVRLASGITEGTYHSRAEMESGLLSYNCVEAPGDRSKCPIDISLMQAAMNALDTQYNTMIANTGGPNSQCNYTAQPGYYGISTCTFFGDWGKLCSLFIQMTPNLIPTPRDPNVNLVGFSCKNSSGNIGIETAVGCIPTQPDKLVNFVIGLSVGLGGLFAFLMLVFNGFAFATAGADPKKIEEAKEGVVNAIAGLLLIIFAVTILGFIGYDILRIPGLNP